MAFDKGHEKLGGRQKGTGNKATVAIKELLNSKVSDEELWKLEGAKMSAASSFTQFNGYQGVPPTNGVFPLADKSVTYEPGQAHALFLDTIVGRHGGLRAVLSQVEIVAPTNAQS